MLAQLFVIVHFLIHFSSTINLSLRINWYRHHIRRLKHISDKWERTGIQAAVESPMLCECTTGS